MSRLHSNEAGPEPPKDIDIFAAAISGPAESTNFPAWYSEMRSKLSVGSGPVFLGRSSPFPYNVEFRPPVTVTDEFRERLVALWRSNTQEWTPRKLSERFKISIERVKAIIKLKVLQSKMEEEGFKVNQKYVERIEQCLNASTPTNAEVPTALEDLTQSMPPKLVAIPEESQISFEEAARILGRKLRPIHQLLDEDLHGDVPFDPSSKREIPIDNAALYIRSDPYEKSRWRYIFIDSSVTAKPVERQIFVREPNGDLRKAAPHERIPEGRRIWGEKHARYIA